ncbi:uncharacterized protein [Nicotiana sylvestris]|uniref:uncharacterized protein n=1 Tax=Nicotiana sylvestris TaxID=4096 RepID=UPI00388C7CFB
MEIDCAQYVRKCYHYQVHTDMIKVPPNELNATSSPCHSPPEEWMSLVRLSPLLQMGIVPKSIVIDNAANLNSDMMKAMCETFKIKHKNSTAYRSQRNGAVEAANKNIKKIVRYMVENHKQWHKKLPFALLGYRTIVRTSTRETPYMLVYGTKAVITAEVEIPSLGIIQEAELSDAE